MRRAVLLLALISCGDDGVHHLADATPTLDTIEPFSAVKVTVTAANLPAQGYTVYFLAADSTPVLATTTDAAGVATANMEPGGSVTVLDPHTTPLFAAGPFSGQVYTVLDVAPGDDIHLDTFPALSQLSVTATVPAQGDPNATYQLYSSCGAVSGLNAGSNNLFALLDPCATADMFLMAFSGQDPTPIGSIFTFDTPVTAGQDLAFTGPYDAPVASTFTFSNTPATQLAVDKQLLSARGPLYIGFGGANLDAGSGTATVAMPPSAGNPLLGQLVSTHFSSSTFNDQTIAEWGPTSDSYALDVGASALEDFSGVPSLAGQTVSWSTTGTGQPADGILTTLAVGRDGNGWQWLVAFPSTAAHSATLPTLPSTDFDLNIDNGATAEILQLAAWRVTGGYRALVGLHPWNTPQLILAPRSPAAFGDTGTAAFANVGF